MYQFDSITEKVSIKSRNHKSHPINGRNDRIQNEGDSDIVFFLIKRESFDINNKYLQPYDSCTLVLYFGSDAFIFVHLFTVYFA